MQVVYSRCFERVLSCPACKQFIWETLRSIGRLSSRSRAGIENAGMGVDDGSRWGMYLNPGLGTIASSTGCIVGCSVSQLPDKGGRWYKERA